MIMESQKVLDYFVKNTDEFVAGVSKDQRKRYGQFFTSASSARFMAQLFDIDLSRSKVEILDAGAGTGILSAALLDRLFECGYTGEVCLTCYEPDSVVLPVLSNNLRYAKEKYRISYEIKAENYITSQYFEENSLLADDRGKYDYVIGNPPYQKIAKDAPEARCMPTICHGAPNLYFLFLAMGIFNLKPGQELVYIITRSWTSGAYFKKFREYLFANGVITDIHLFESRDKVFGSDSVLQETLIVKVKKTHREPAIIHVTSSSTSDFTDLKRFDAPYHVVIPKSQLVHLITDRNDAEVLEKVNRFSCTLPQMQLRMQTGVIVDFRTPQVLRDKMEAGAYPLLYSQHIKDGMVIWPLGREGEVIKTERKAYLQENSDYLLIKRFTSKEEKRRLQCGIFLKSRYIEYKYISTQNKVNFIKCDSPELTYGLYVILNSTMYDSYYRILNGSTQVNSTEINQIPMPEKAVIELMGREMMNSELTEYNCDRILERWIR